MRGPLINLSPGLGASGVDMEYRRNSQGALKAQIRALSPSSLSYSL